MKLFGHLNKDRDIAVLAGAFNPPTIAHWQLALAARRHVGQTLLVVPGRLPHKDPRRASLDERVDLLRDLDPDLPIAVTEGGLFIDIAREIRRDAQIGGRIYFACGRDAAQRGDIPGVLDDLIEAWQKKPDGTTWKGCTEDSAKGVSIRAIGGLT